MRSKNYKRRDGRVCLIRAVTQARRAGAPFDKTLYFLACGESEGSSRQRKGRTNDTLTCLACLAAGPDEAVRLY